MLEKLDILLGKRPNGVAELRYAMSYGNPSLNN